MLFLFIEDSKTELKEIYTEDIKKEIIAFLNTRGGTLYIGISDHGDIIGLADPDKIRISIDNLLTNGIYPNVTSLVSTEIVTDPITAKQYIKCSISEGIDKPYHFKHSRLTSSSIFIRVGSSCVSAEDSIIEQMLRESRRSYETMPSLQQDLTFVYAEQIFSSQGIAFGEAQKISLKLKTASGIYTNLGLLLSDQCPHFIKAAAFRDAVGIEFVSKEDMLGSILMQFDYAYKFASMYDTIHTRYEGPHRIDIYDYPLIAVREALLNAIMHRDYGSSSPTLFKVFSDRMELVSFGGLSPELTESSLAEGISSCRNPNLAIILVKLGLVESFGTGIPKIFATYHKSRTQPKFTIKPNMFKITLPKFQGNDPTEYTHIFSS